jgi:hypothetical protein
MHSKLPILSRLLRSPIRVAGLLSFSLCAWAQIGLVHVTTCGGPAPFPATTCPVPSTGSGNLLVVGWASNSGAGATTISGITDNAGNAYLEAGSARAVDSHMNDMGDVWYAKNSVAGATVLTITPNPTGTSGTAVIWEFSGLDTNAPLDQAAVLNSQPATTTPAGAPVTTAVPNELVVSIGWVQDGVTSIVSGNPFTNDSLATGDGWAHYVASSPGTYSAQWNMDLGTYGSSTVSFKSASAAASAAVVPAGACDLNKDGVVNVLDVQLAVNIDLGALSCPVDINGGVCGSTLVQQVLSGALGEGCSATISHSVSLSWAASTSPNIAGYNVYRSTASGGPYTQLNSPLVLPTSFTDANVTAGQTYYYVTTAVDTSNNQSAYSNQAQATVPSP